MLSLPVNDIAHQNYSRQFKTWSQISSYRARQVLVTWMEEIWKWMQIFYSDCIFKNQFYGKIRKSSFKVDYFDLKKSIKWRFLFYVYALPLISRQTHIHFLLGITHSKKLIWDIYGTSLLLLLFDVWGTCRLNTCCMSQFARSICFKWFHGTNLLHSVIDFVRSPIKMNAWLFSIISP